MTPNPKPAQMSQQWNAYLHLRHSNAYIDRVRAPLDGDAAAAPSVSTWCTAGE